jgi:hypothetical protein
MMTTQEIRRHCERSEAIHGSAGAGPGRQWLDAPALDGFVAALFAMTVAEQAQGTHPLHFDHSIHSRTGHDAIDLGRRRQAGLGAGAGAGEAAGARGAG